MHSTRGQASADYIGVIGLVALVLTLAGAVAAPDLPGAVAHHVRVGLCIVGGDVCRAADAERQGLEPCVLRVHGGDKHTRVNVTILSYGTGKGFAIERRSDGSAHVVATSDSEGGAVAGVGIRLGPQVDVGAEAGGAVGWASGIGWEFPDEAELQRFLQGVEQSPGRLAWDAVKRHGRKPTERFEAGTGDIRAGAGASVFGVEQALAAGGGRGALGRRLRAGGGTTWYFDARHVGPRLFGGLIAEVEIGRPGAWTLELSDRPRELRLRTTLPRTGARQVELEARLDLRVAGNRAVARDLLARPSLARARALGRHVAEHGTVERREYRVRELRGDPDVAVKLGIAGLDHSGSGYERTLEAAEVLRAGGRARRADCLGL
jgi:hypothetical protein